MIASTFPARRALAARFALPGVLVAMLAACAGGPPARTAAPSSAAPKAAAQSAKPLQPVTEVEGISEYRLPNGLKVLLFPDPSVSSVTVNVTYLVGSRHEGPGEGGMAHLLEHMLFKGSPAIPNPKAGLQDRGAQFNGSTSFDRTNYYETLNASDENLDWALKMEADRMVNCWVRKEDLDTEMTVVRNEFERGENSPGGILFQRMLASAYSFHSYGRPTIGNQSDIERVPIPSLQAFYRKYYQPDNAVLVVSGRFETERALDGIQRSFGVIPRPQRTLPATYTVEPPQDGERSVLLSRVGSIGSAGVVYHIPAASHPDTTALDVLSEVLASRPSGRLYKALVETKKATTVSASAYSLREPGVFIASASVPLDRDPEDVQHLLIDQIEKVAGTIRKEEVDRARNRMLKDLRLALTDSRRIALSLSEYEASGDWRLLFVGRDQLSKVTLDDVNRVARTYLIGSNRTAGLFRPVQKPLRAEIPQAPALASLVDQYKGVAAVETGERFEATTENIERSTQRVKVGAIDVALLPKKTRGAVVQGRVRLWYGTEQTLKNRDTAASIMPALMMRGTAKRNFQGIQDRMDEIETDLSITGGTGWIDASFRTTRAHLKDAIDLMAEILRTPTFPASELELMRKQRITGIKASMTDPQGRLSNALDRALSPYPKESLLYRPTLEEAIERVKKVKLGEVSELHRRFLGAGHAQASFVGDFDGAELQKLLGAALGDWKSKEPHKRIESPYLAVSKVEQTLDTPDKKMAVVARGTAFRMRSDDPDYPALRFANYVLGQSQKSRLWNALREKGGLSYSVSSDIEVSDENEVSYLTASAIAAPENARRAQSLMRKEFERWLAEPISQRELEEFRAGYLASFRRLLGDNGYLASALLIDIRLDRPFKYRQQVIESALKLSGEDLQKAIRQHLGSMSFVDFVAGDSAKFGAGTPPQGE